jgi:hypothetical protein
MNYVDVEYIIYNMNYVDVEYIIYNMNYVDLEYIIYNMNYVDVEYIKGKIVHYTKNEFKQNKKHTTQEN